MLVRTRCAFSRLRSFKLEAAETAKLQETKRAVRAELTGAVEGCYAWRGSRQLQLARVRVLTERWQALPPLAEAASSDLQQAAETFSEADAKVFSAFTRSLPAESRALSLAERLELFRTLDADERSALYSRAGSKAPTGNPKIKKSAPREGDAKQKAAEDDDSWDF
ncbi:hypothetical protein DIPPA_19422 [Diplonema papillatum]|nr:hypothetical protein DIPPA_14316 [Diplonema papillatum]KAJ9440409.1 hypothetical protein DIPPA_19422 [Diplonema papillatum]